MLNSKTQVAIIGMAGRFPKCPNIESYWKNLLVGANCLTTYNSCIDNANQFVAHGKHNVAVGGTLENIEYFDANFFNITPNEAERMDPQHRFFLECAWIALEDAGYLPSSYSGKIGVFAGASVSTYMLYNLLSSKKILQSDLWEISLGNIGDNLPTKVSYHMGLRGPSVNIQTSCSTSLVAVHVACQSLLNYECELAIAGAVSIHLPAYTGYQYEDGRILSKNGQIRAFDHNADGTILTDGIGVIVLKRLEDAIRDRDTIDAIILGSAINNDGDQKISYTASSSAGQYDVINSAIQIAGIKCNDIGYIESHGTGTILGDAVELKTLSKIFDNSANYNHPIYLGAVKNNIGHTDVASGIAGLIKAVLSVREGIIPPTINFDKPNPHIDWSLLNLEINKKCVKWNLPSEQRVAGISSFGIGGTNAHVIIRGHKPFQLSCKKSREIIIFSAKNKESLVQEISNFKNYLENKQDNELSLSNIAFTKFVGRKTYNFRKAYIVSEPQDLIYNISALDYSKIIEIQKDLKICFVFPGQGSQFEGMAYQLYREDQGFRLHMDYCFKLLKKISNLDLKPLVVLKKRKNRNTIDINDTKFAQLGLFITEYCLALRIMELGVTPFTMIGHSVGEYVTAALSGIFGLEESLRILIKRGELSALMPSGSMLAVNATENVISTYLDKNVWIAVRNAPDEFVLSGVKESILNIANSMKEKGVPCLLLKTSNAFHCPLANSISIELENFISNTGCHPPQNAVVTATTGNWLTEDEAISANFWANHIKTPVNFSKALSTVILQEKTANLIFIEVGPPIGLGRIVQKLASINNNIRCSTKQTISKQHNSTKTSVFYSLLGSLWEEGIEIKWSVLKSTLCNRVHLPSYPLQHQKFWIDGDELGRTIDSKNYKNNIYYACYSNKSIFSSSLDNKSITGFKKVLILSNHKETGDYIKNNLKNLGFICSEVIPYPIRAEDIPELIPDIIVWHQDNLITVEPIQLYQLLKNKLVELSRTIQLVSHRWPGYAIKIHCLSEFPQDQKMLDMFYNNIVTQVIGIVVKQELPLIDFHHIAYSPIQKDSKLSAAVFENIQVLSNNDASIKELVNAGGLYWQRKLKLLPKSIETTDKHVDILKKNGVYIIIGAMGKIGQELKQYLCNYYQAQLVLVGRNVNENITGQNIIISADITCENEMERVLSVTEKRWGIINGIFNLVSLPTNELHVGITELNEQNIDTQLKPKILGALVIDKLIKNRSIDFVVLFSSIASVLGGLGYTAYATANRFLEQFSEIKHVNGDKRWRTIAWDHWIFEKNYLNTEFGYSMNMHGISTSYCLEGLGFLISLKKPVLYVAAGDIEERLNKWQFSIKSDVITKEQKDDSQHSEDPDIILRTKLANIWNNVLGIYPNVKEEANFFNIGGNSLFATRLAALISNFFGISFSVRDVLNYPRLEDQILIVQERVLETIENLSNKETENLLNQETNETR